MESLQLASKIVNVLDSKIGEDIQLIKIEELTTLTDYFVIATGTSTTHVKALAEEVEFQLKQQDVQPLHIEGSGTNSWILLDYGYVIVHVFNSEARDFYSLERLWKDGTNVDISDIIEG